MKKGNIVDIGKIAVLGIAIFLICLMVFLSFFYQDKDNGSSFSLGERYLENMNYDKAVFFYEEMISVEPANVESYLNLYKVYLSSGEEDKAIEALAKGYDRTQDYRIYRKLSAYEYLSATCSATDKYYDEEYLIVSINGKAGTEISYILDDGTEKLYKSPITLHEGFHQLKIFTKGEYTHRAGPSYTYNYTVGKMPIGIETVKYFKESDNNVSLVHSHCNDEILVQKGELWGTVDYDFNIIHPIQEKEWVLESSSDRKDIFEYHVTGAGIENKFGELIYKNSSTLNISNVQIPYCFDEKIIVFKDSVSGKMGIMNMRGEIIEMPGYVDKRGRGMTNPDHDMVIATEGNDRVLLKAVYEDDNTEA